VRPRKLCQMDVRVMDAIGEYLQLHLAGVHVLYNCCCLHDCDNTIQDTVVNCLHVIAC
jgi:hypothetical protein